MGKMVKHYKLDDSKGHGEQPGDDGTKGFFEPAEILRRQWALHFWEMSAGIKEWENGGMEGRIHE